MDKTTAAHFSLRQQKITLANRPSPGQPITTSPGSVQPLLVRPLHSSIKQAGNRSNSILRLSIKKPCYNFYLLEKFKAAEAHAPRELLPVYQTFTAHELVLADYLRLEQDGSARAQYKLGSIYDEGKGVPEDERIGIITGLFDRKSEYRIRSVACLFDGRVEPYDE